MSCQLTLTNSVCSKGSKNLPCEVGRLTKSNHTPRSLFFCVRIETHRETKYDFFLPIKDVKKRPKR